MAIEPAPTWTLQPVIDWIISEGRLLPNLNDLTAQLATQLIKAGLPLWRVRISMRTLHPLITASSAAWEREGGVVDMPNAAHGLESRPSYVGSPLQVMADTRQPFRRILADTLGADDHLVLRELKNRGATDYFGAPMVFSEGPVGLVVFVTDTPDGFSDTDIDHLFTLIRVLTPVVEVFQLKHSAQAITEAYLGARSAKRVLSGQITRGHIETVRAAILFSDIRGWTAINTRLPPSDTVAIANTYFDRIEGAVRGHGGEVLKMLGDGVLAIFIGETDAQACAQAMAAAQAAHKAAQDDPDFTTRFGIGMHVGEVLYGNVGSAERLDFTVLGAAVNLASRIEGFCSRLDQDILFSEEFAKALKGPARHIGTEQIKGLTAPQRIYCPS